MYKTSRQRCEKWLIMEIKTIKGEIIMEKVELVDGTQELQIELVQNPIIKYDAIDSISTRVKKRIEALDLANLEITEENLEEVKKMNALLSAEFKEHEEKRAYIKSMVEDPYKKFKEKYDAGIKNIYTEAQNKIKTSIDAFNIDLARKYFDATNEFDFINFEDVGLSFKVNSSQETIRDKIDDYICQIKSDMQVIKNVENKDRVKAKYQICKDLNKAIAQVAQEVKIEEENKARELEANKLIKEQEVLHAEPNLFTVEKQNTKEEIPQEDNALVFATFKVTGSIAQLKSLKQFMESEGIIYE